MEGTTTIDETFLKKLTNFIMGKSLLPSMESADSQADWEKDIVETEWTDRDTEIVAQDKIDTKFLHLKDVDKLD